MNFRFVSSLLVASVLSMNCVQAASNVAEISSIQGKVLVNQGKGFVTLANSSILNAGDRVMVGKKSSAVIAYANGCVVTVGATKVVTVGKSAPCKSGSIVIAPVADVSVAPAVYDPTLPLVFIGGALVVGGGVLLLNNNNNNGVPVSP